MLKGSLFFFFLKLWYELLNMIATHNAFLNVQHGIVNTGTMLHSRSLERNHPCSCSSHKCHLKECAHQRKQKDLMTQPEFGECVLYHM